MRRNVTLKLVTGFFTVLLPLSSFGVPPAVGSSTTEESVDQVLEWNQIFIDILIATNTPNASSQRLGAIVHTAVFDAYNGIERRYTPIYVTDEAPRGANRRAAVVAAAYTALYGLFTSTSIRAELTQHYYASLDAITDDDEDGGQSLERGVDWGTYVAQQILAWRATDGFSTAVSSFTGGLAIGQWRPTSAQNPTCTAMSAQTLAFTSTFVVPSNSYFRPPPPRSTSDPSYLTDLAAVRALGVREGSTRNADQTSLAPFWEGNASTHWNQAANQLSRQNHVSISDNSRLFAVLNIAMADAAFTTWSGKRFYGADSTAVTWRPFTAIREGVVDPDPTWVPLVNTPCHPEYPAGHPAQNGTAATVLLSKFGDASGEFTLTTGSATRTYMSITQARNDGNDARVWGGMHYPTTIAASDAMGSLIAIYVDQTAMQRVSN